jgi:hypothetical protein
MTPPVQIDQTTSTRQTIAVKTKISRLFDIRSYLLTTTLPRATPNCELHPREPVVGFARRKS